MEICVIGHEFGNLSPRVSGLKKHNRAAMVVSNEANTALRWFPASRGLRYNDVMKKLYKALYELNIEVDVIFDRETDWSRYDILFFPQLYCASQEMVDHVRSFVKNGGTVFATFRSFFTDENLRIRPAAQPYGLTDVFGMTYDQFTEPSADHVTVGGSACEYWMELLRPSTAETVASYEHKYWGRYAAVTRHDFGDGHAWYLGSMIDSPKLKEWDLAIVEENGSGWRMCMERT